MHVLQVEDDAATAAAVERMLASVGDTCDTVALGLDAIERAQQNAYDLILLDIALPDIDGFEVLRRLQRLGINIPVLVQSGLVDRDRKFEGLSLGVDDFIVKPFGKTELTDRIESVVRPARRTENAYQIKNPTERAPNSRATTQKDRSERRQSKRVRTLKSGRILYNHALYVVDCLILNLTETGAKLAAVDICDCPETFILQVRNGPSLRCAVRWQSGKMLGVTFVQ